MRQRTRLHKRKIPCTQEDHPMTQIHCNRVQNWVYISIISGFSYHLSDNENCRQFPSLQNEGIQFYYMPVTRLKNLQFILMQFHQTESTGRTNASLKTKKYSKHSIWKKTEIPRSHFYRNWTKEPFFRRSSIFSPDIQYSIVVYWNWTEANTKEGITMFL